MAAGRHKTAETDYPDGIYRGFYYDGGLEQIVLQFELKDGAFVSIVYRSVKYKDGDYMIEDASDAQKATLAQYRQMADYLVGKGVEAISDLYQPYDIVQDVDAVTTATIQSSKLISALCDGLNRRPFKLVNTSKLPQPQPYADGLYRGSYMEDGWRKWQWNSRCGMAALKACAIGHCITADRIIWRKMRRIRCRGWRHSSNSC